MATERIWFELWEKLTPVERAAIPNPIGLDGKRLRGIAVPHFQENLQHFRQRTGRMRCRECNRTKRLGLFYKEKHTFWRYNYMCKACYKVHRKASVEKQREWSYKTNFNISLEEYETLLQEQGGRCYICGKRPASKRLSVDHDHAREKCVGTRESIRGLLCSMCNRYLGHIGDRPEVGTKLSEYLTRPSWVERTGL